MTNESLDTRIAALAAAYRPLAASILAEVVRIPADHVAEDPSCGLSNHEAPRLEWLRRRLFEIGAVRRPEDAFFDAFGNLVWTLEDPDDGVPRADKKVVYFDGHSDTVKALRSQWIDKIGGGIDAYDGLTDPSRVDRAFLEQQLGWLPPADQWEHLLFGRGTADQLGGVVAQAVASKILLELAPLGALRGVVIRSYATVAEEDNDGGGPMYVTRGLLPEAPEWVPDAVVLTEGTGDSTKGALGIYRGQRGRMQIEVVVTGRSCHGSMPWEGLNPLEYGAAILVEAAEQYRAGEGFAQHAFLGGGTRTASWATLESPSDCAVPDRFTFRFDRRITAGEVPEEAVAAIEGLKAVAAAREAGLGVEVRVPVYDQPTWTGYVLNNPQVYLGWETPEEHPAIRAAVASYRGVVSPHVPEGGAGGELRREPRVDRWIFSTDGVGFPIPVEGSGVEVPASKGWVRTGAFHHPPMFGVGPGIEQNTHKIGEAVDLRELQHAIAMLARFPSRFAGG
jgi:putative selenium metabolism hydrolase